ncbi:xylose isomerase [Rathayibacter sp. AY1E2]|nr:xylose isomerase [Rathayibacter sp. AY1E2]
MVVARRRSCPPVPDDENEARTVTTAPATTASENPAPWTLSGFGDEIDPDPVVQVAVLRALGAHSIEVRSAWGRNVVDLDDERLARLAAVLERGGQSVSAVASPIGKVDVALDPELEVARLDRVIRVAHTLGTPSIRVFSFYRGEGVPVENIRDDVLLRMRRLADRAEREGVVLLHENEKDIYGDVPERILDLVESVGSPALRLAWDNANFVQCGVRPFDDGWTALRPYVDYLQVKDAVAATGTVVPAGEGDGQLRETLTALRDDGWTGVASLEPHLAITDALGGFSGPESFGVAARAFRGLASSLGIDLR